MKLDDIKKLFKKHNVGPDLGPLREFLGQGTQGTVYRYGRDKVIKFGDWDGGINPRYRKEWLSLFKTLKKSNYKYIVKPYDIGFIDNAMYWYTTEYLASQIDSSDIGHFMKVYRILDYEWGISDHKPNPGIYEELPTKWKKFLKSLRKFEKKSGFKNYDLHDENVMLNDLGVPKLIDLEAFIGCY